MNKLFLSDERYKIALERIKKQIEDGSELVAIDSDEIGEKYTHCSWGLCSNSIDQWPDKEDWLHKHKRTKDIYTIPFDGTYYEDKWVNVKYQDTGQHCALDKDQSKETDPMGCFYRCKIFQDGLKSRQEAVRLYEETIARNK